MVDAPSMPEFVLLVMRSAKGPITLISAAACVASAAAMVTPDEILMIGLSGLLASGWMFYENGLCSRQGVDVDLGGPRYTYMVLAACLDLCVPLSS